MINLYTNKNTNEIFNKSGLKKYLKSSTPLQVMEEVTIKDGISNLENIRSSFYKINLFYNLYCDKAITTLNQDGEYRELRKLNPTDYLVIHFSANNFNFPNVNSKGESFIGIHSGYKNIGYHYTVERIAEKRDIPVTFGFKSGLVRIQFDATLCIPAKIILESEEEYAIPKIFQTYFNKFAKEKNFPMIKILDDSGIKETE